MISVNTLDSPARELSLPTTYTPSAQNPVRLFSHRIKGTRPPAPLTERGCRQPRLLVGLMHCACFRFMKGSPESLPALPFVTQIGPTMSTQQKKRVPLQTQLASLKELRDSCASVLGMNYSLTWSVSPDGERRKKPMCIGEYFRFKNSKVSCQLALPDPPDGEGNPGKDRLSDSDCTQAENFRTAAGILKMLLAWTHLLNVRFILGCQAGSYKLTDPSTGILWVKKERNIKKQPERTPEAAILMAAAQQALGLLPAVAADGLVPGGPCSRGNAGHTC